MQPLAFLWVELQIAQQRLGETFAESQFRDISGKADHSLRRSRRSIRHSGRWSMFFRVYPKPLVFSYPPFSISRMAEPNLSETSGNYQPTRDGCKKKNGTINKQTAAWPIRANAGSIIRNLKPVIDEEVTKMSTKIEQFSYALKLVALTHLYMELSLPLAAALRAAKSDLR